MHTQLLSCAQLDLSILIQLSTLCLGNGATHSGLGPPTSASLVRLLFTDKPTGKCNENNPFVELSPQVVLGCVKLTIKLTTVVSIGASRGCWLLQFQIWVI